MPAMMVSRAFDNVLTEDVAVTRDFYVHLLELTIAFDSDWFVNLTSPSRDGSPACELGIWRRAHELISEQFR